MRTWEEIRGLVEEARGSRGLEEVLASIGPSELEELAERCWSLRLARFGRELQVFYPWRRFPAISITGHRCELGCKYCRGRYLRGMISAETPGELIRVCSSLAEKGAEGILISGGYTREGILPVGPFLEAIRHVKEHFGLRIAIHPGLVGPDMACELAEAGVDLALCEVFGDEETLREAVGLRRHPGDYLASMRALKEAGLRLAPHICLGIRGGRLSGELEALRMARDVGPDVLVLIIFIPTPGTPYGDRSPPDPADVEKLMALARLMLPDVPMALGCMRPRRGPYREAVEEAALRMGFNRMALPGKKALELARRLGLEVVRREVCCALP